MHGTTAKLDELGESEVLEGVKQFPIRIKCALLAWVALEDGIKKHTEAS